MNTGFHYIIPFVVGYLALTLGSGLILGYIKRRMILGLGIMHLSLGIIILIIAHISEPLIDYYLFDIRFLTILYFSVIYILEILFLEEQALSFMERLRRIKANNAIFDAVLAAKQQDVKGVNHAIEKGLKYRPNDPLLNRMKRNIYYSNEQKQISGQVGKVKWFNSPIFRLRLKWRKYTEEN